MPHVTRRGAVLAAVAALFLAPARMHAQDGYKQPPDPIRQILDAEPTPLVSVSPDRSWLLLLERNALPSITEVAAPEVHLAGDRIDPRTNGRSRDITYKGLRLRGVAGTTERGIVTPEDARIGTPIWSPNGRHVAFAVTGDSGIALYVADVATGESRRLSELAMNGATGVPCAWMSSSAALLCKTVPAGRGPAPSAPATPAGPIVQESEGRAAPNRTYQDLLQSPADEALFDHYFTSQLAVVPLDGASALLGEPAAYVEAEPSPDGNYVLTERVHRPYSYVVPMSRFPTSIEVWDANGRVVKQIADRPLLEEMSTAFDAVEPGPRDVAWRADAPATLVWSQALDDGDPARDVPKRDRVYTLAAPFTASPAALADLDFRASGITWARDDLAFVDELWWKTRRARTWVVNPSTPAAAPRLLFDRSAEDRYADPGRFATAVSERGTRILLTTPDGRAAYLLGQGASAEGDRPFLDRVDLASGKSTRLWRSAAPYYEEVVAVVDRDGRRAITRRESVKEPPNYYLRQVGRKDALTRLTSFADPAPQFAGVTSRLITYKRPDGVQLSATMYLPAGYSTEQGALPFFFWAYPQEFKTAAAAAQVRGSPYRFTRPSGASHLFLLTQGYGVLDGPTMPIVGEGDEEPNDTYTEQLVASARAAVDEVVRLGVADRERVAVGGHSYGAFMTANLLAHSNLFRAGIARSGAYNRTLTPFGFQAEERPYWKAREIYEKMSPFTYADSIKAPVLLIHGMADDNSGTFPVQSERFFAALKGNGAKVRYVQLPAEAHGYRARESVGHTLWEMVNWLDTYVKVEPKAAVVP
jgi:dipeptidyl aminopeptidase/acylaminoacyl peptidase